jgi:hypothetical protein
MAIKFLNTVEVDTNVLYVNTSSNRVGIVTASPRTSLDINGPLSVMGGTFTSGDSGADSISGAGIVLRRGKKLLSGIPGNGNEDFHLRNLIGHDSGNNINIGQTGTSLIGNISLSTGTSGNVIFNTIGSENLRIASNGRVGIGTTSPTAKLNVRGDLHIRHTSSSTTAFKVQGSGGDDVWFEITPNSSTVFILGDEEQSSGGGYIKLDSNANITFNEADVGINTSNPTEKLEVNGTVKATNYKGYVPTYQSGGFFHSSSSSTSTIYWIPTNYIVETTSGQYYNNWVAPYDGRVRKIIMRYTNGSTPTATSVTFKWAKNGSTQLSSYSATVTNGASTSMVASYSFGDSNITFSEGDRIQLGFTTNGPTARLLNGFAYTILFEYNKN